MASNCSKLDRSRGNQDSQSYAPRALYVPVIDERIFIAQNIPKPRGQGIRCLSTTGKIEYEPLCDDFGPMNISSIARFIDQLDQEIAEYPESKIVYLVETGKRCLSNGLFLMGSYLVIKHGQEPEEIWKRFRSLPPSMIEPFRDATFAPSDFDLSIVDCWRALRKGKGLGWIQAAAIGSRKWGEIDMDNYELLESPECGDLVEVVPSEFVAFKGPKDVPKGGKKYRDVDGVREFSPSFYIDIFRTLNVTTVVRLNAACYDPAPFVAAGIQHFDLPFDDCTAPRASVMTAFFRIVDSAEGVVAVHCKAGLGRTGTLIALQLMRKHGFTALEAIAWLRIMRPGCVIGEQQHYLCHLEPAAADDISAERSDLNASPEEGEKTWTVTGGLRRSLRRAMTDVGRAATQGPEGDQFVRMSGVSSAKLAEQVSAASDRRLMRRVLGRSASAAHLARPPSPPPECGESVRGPSGALVRPGTWPGTNLNSAWLPCPSPLEFYPRAGFHEVVAARS